MMTVLPLAKIGKLLNRLDYLEEAKHQFLIHIKYLQDKKSGLWYHGWTFEEIITMRKHCGQEGTAGLRLLFQKLLKS